MLSVNAPHAGLRVYASFFCGVDYDSLLFLFCMRLFDLRLCAFCVWADGFASLYVSEFLTFACGVSPLRGRPKDSALWNPAALERLANFFFWVRIWWCCRSLAALFCFSFYCYCDRNLLRFAVLSLKLICRYYRFRRFRLPALIRQPQLHYPA